MEVKICPVCHEKNNPKFVRCWKCENSFFSENVPLRERKIAGYKLFSTCPFTVSQIGGGGGFGGIDIQSYVWTHRECLMEHCRLWTYRLDAEQKVIAEGCSLQFIGLSDEQVQKNDGIKKGIKADFEK